MKKHSELIGEELEAMRAEIQTINEQDDADDETIARGESLLEEWKARKVAYDKAVKREEDVADVLRARLTPSRVEPSEPRRAPEVIVRQDPYDNNDELHRSLIGRASFNTEDVISRAQTAVDSAPKHVNDLGKERLHELLELDNVHAPLIARHVLLTGSPEYHEQFADYVKSRGYRVGEAMRAALSLTDANGGFHLVAAA